MPSAKELETGLTREKLRELFDYNPDTGHLVWKRLDRFHAVKGNNAGNIDGKGYRRIGIDGRVYSAHRLIWMWVHGEWPTYLIDHINGVRSDNRICNLRDATYRVNRQNQKSAMTSNKSCGVLGVTWNRRAKRWQSGISTSGRYVYLGLFDTVPEAEAAYISAKRKLHDGCVI